MTARDTRGPAKAAAASLCPGIKVSTFQTPSPAHFPAHSSGLPLSPANLTAQGWPLLESRRPRAGLPRSPTQAQTQPLLQPSIPRGRGHASDHPPGPPPGPPPGHPGWGQRTQDARSPRAHGMIPTAHHGPAPPSAAQKATKALPWLPPSCQAWRCPVALQGSPPLNMNEPNGKRGQKAGGLLFPVDPLTPTRLRPDSTQRGGSRSAARGPPSWVQMLRRRVPTYAPPSQPQRHGTGGK